MILVCFHTEDSAIGRSLPRGVLPSVVCLSVIEDPLRGGLRLLGSCHEKIINST